MCRRGHARAVHITHFSAKVNGMSGQPISKHGFGDFGSCLFEQLGKKPSKDSSTKPKSTK
jgi:hypothetical protein